MAVGYDPEAQFGGEPHRSAIDAICTPFAARARRVSRGCRHIWIDLWRPLALYVKGVAAVLRSTLAVRISHGSVPAAMCFAVCGSLIGSTAQHSTARIGVDRGTAESTNRSSALAVTRDAVLEFVPYRLAARGVASEVNSFNSITARRRTLTQTTS